MIYRVYHADPPNFTGETDRARRHQDYVFVSLVETPHTDEVTALDEVYARTNHIDSNWLMGAGLAPAVDQARSTSVGDVIKDEAGRAWMVASSGFEELFAR